MYFAGMISWPLVSVVMLVIVDVVINSTNLTVGFVALFYVFYCLCFNRFVEGEVVAACCDLWIGLIPTLADFVHQ